MIREDMGYDAKTGNHRPTLTTVEGRFLGLLWEEHSGAGNKIGADELAVRFEAAYHGLPLLGGDLGPTVNNWRRYRTRDLGQWKRHVRRMHNHLLDLHENVPILSQAGLGGGYWVAADEAEAEAFYETFRKRGMTGLRKACRGKKAVLVDIMRQMSFEFDDLEDRSGIPDPGRAAEASAPIQVVDAFLEKMSQNPERFEADLRRLGRKFGSVLLPKSQVAAMREKAAEMQALLAGLGV